jgi:membrane protease YdiL (CAAX protease family)
MNIKSFIQRRPLLSYFVLAYGITWSAILVFLASKGFQLATLHMQDGLIIFVMMFLGPSTSALVLTATLDGRSGLRELWTRLTRWQVGLPWYAVALLTVPLLTLVIVSALSALISPVYAPSFRVLGVVVGLLAGGFEEIGWTGFATPRLLNKHTWLISGFILGLVWSLWHMLADVSSHISSMGATGWALWFVIYWILPLTAYRILMTWVYTKIRSLLLAQLMHASYSGWLFILSPATSDQDLLWQAIFAAALWVVVAIVAISQQRVARTLQLQTGKSY